MHMPIWNKEKIFGGTFATRVSYLKKKTKGGGEICFDCEVALHARDVSVPSWLDSSYPEVSLRQKPRRVSNVLHVWGKKKKKYKEKYIQ